MNHHKFTSYSTYGAFVVAFSPQKIITITNILIHTVDYAVCECVCVCAFVPNSSGYFFPLCSFLFFSFSKHAHTLTWFSQWNKIWTRKKYTQNPKAKWAFFSFLFHAQAAYDIYTARTEAVAIQLKNVTCQRIWNGKRRSELLRFNVKERQKKCRRIPKSVPRQKKKKPATTTDLWTS